MPSCYRGSRVKDTSPAVIYITGAAVGLWLSGAGIGWLDEIVGHMMSWPIFLNGPFNDPNGL